VGGGGSRPRKPLSTTSKERMFGKKIVRGTGVIMRYRQELKGEKKRKGRVKKEEGVGVVGDREIESVGLAGLRCLGSKIKERSWEKGGKSGEESSAPGNC